MRRIIASVAALLMAIVSAAAVLAGSASAVPGPAQADPGGLTIAGCIVRFPSSAGPVLLNGSGHACSPLFTSASVDGFGNLVIGHGDLGTVVAAAVTPDESLIVAPRSITGVGASVGFTSTTVRFTYNDGVVAAVTGPHMVCSSCNAFVILLYIPAPEPTPSPSPTQEG